MWPFLSISDNDLIDLILGTTAYVVMIVIIVIKEAQTIFGVMVILKWPLANTSCR